MDRIFISYRRGNEEDARFTRQLVRNLQARIERYELWVDHESSPPTEERRAAIEERIRGSHCLVAVIGAGWFEDPEAPAVDEVRHALKLDVPVLVVLVGEASIPAGASLPSGLRALRNVITSEPGAAVGPAAVALAAAIRTLAGPPGYDASLDGAPETAEGTVMPLPNEHVEFSVYRPSVMRPEDWTPLLVFTYLDEDGGPDGLSPREQVEREAASILAERRRDYRENVEHSLGTLPREGEVSIQVEVEGARVEPSNRSFIWATDMRVHREAFSILAPADAAGRVLRGRVTVLLGSLLLADVGFTTRVDASAQGTASERIAVKRHHRVFASYAHRDARIVRELTRYATTLGISYLKDVTDLRSGEVWSEKLKHLIEDADIFQLFWSRNAARSPFVETEWHHALGLGRPDGFIRPTYWEEPMPPAPAPLSRLQFQRVSVADEDGVSEDAVPKPEPDTYAAPAGRVTYSTPSSGERRRRLPVIAGLATVGALVIALLVWDRTPPSPPDWGPVAIVVSTEGDVFVKRGERRRLVVAPEALRVGDVLEPGSGAEALLLWPDQQVETLRDRRTFETMRADAPEDEEVFGVLLAKVTRMDEPPWDVTTPITRGRLAPVPLFPRTRLLDGRPTFSWRGTAPDARYRLRVTRSPDAEGGPQPEVLVEDVAADAFVWPGARAALEPGGYAFTVQALAQGGDAAEADLRSEAVHFRVLSAEERATIEARRTAFEKAVADVAGATRHVLRACFLEQDGVYLLADARTSWLAAQAARPGSEAVARMLADVERRMQLPESTPP